MDRDTFDELMTAEVDLSKPPEPYIPPDAADGSQSGSKGSAGSRGRGAKKNATSATSGGPGVIPGVIERVRLREERGLEYGVPDMSTAPPLDPLPPDPPLPPKDTWRQWGLPKAPSRLGDIRREADTVPPNSWLDRYIAWASDITDAPPVFHWLVGVSVLAAAMSRNWTIKHGYNTLSARVFGLIVGTSGSRKSASVSLGIDLLPSDLVERASYGSQQAFIDAVEEQPEQLWVQQEAGSVVRQLGEKYHKSYAQLLCQVYDGDPIAQVSRTRGRVAIDNYQVGLLFASTEQGLVPPDDKNNNTIHELVRTGLFGRFWLAASNYKIAEYDDPRPGDPRVRKWLEDTLATTWTFDRPVECALAPDAYEELRIWAKQYTNSPPSPVLEGLWERRAVHAKKLAMIYQAAQGMRAGTAINKQTMLYAINAMHRIVFPSHRYVLESLTASRHQKLLEKLTKKLETATYIKWADVPGFLGISQARAAEVVAGLHDRIHWERWKIKPVGVGNSFLVLCYGRPGQLATVDPNCYRTKDSAAAPAVVKRALDEKEDAHILPPQTDVFDYD